MKIIVAIVAALVLVISGAAAQTVTNHAFAIGKGAGNTGFTSVTCGANQLPMGQAGADPVCTTVQFGAGSLGVNTQSGDYTIAASDCGGTVVETGALKTITLPASLAGFPSICIVIIKNVSTTRAQALAGFPTGFAGSGCGSQCLYPLQAGIVQIVSSAWSTAVAPGRYQAATQTLYFAATGCSNNNDGMVSGSPFCSINTCIVTLQTNFDNLATNPTCQFASTGTITEAVQMVGQAGNIKDFITVNGNAVSSTSYIVTGTSGNPAFFARDLGILNLTNMEIDCNGNMAVYSSQFSTIDLTNITHSGCAGQDMQFAQDGGHIDWNAPGVTVSSSATSIVHSQGSGSEIIIPGGAVLTCTGAFAYSQAAWAEKLGGINASGLTTSGCGSATGQKGAATGNGIITGSATFPGGSACAVATQGLCL